MFSVEIEIVLTLLQNVSNRGVVGGDGGVCGCGGGGGVGMIEAIGFY